MDCPSSMPCGVLIFRISQMLIFRREPTLIPLVRFESTRHKRGSIVFFQVLPNFRKQSVGLFGQAVIGTAESKSQRK